MLLSEIRYEYTRALLHVVLVCSFVRLINYQCDTLWDINIWWFFVHWRPEQERKSTIWDINPSYTRQSSFSLSFAFVCCIFTYLQCDFASIEIKSKLKREKKRFVFSSLLATLCLERVCVCARAFVRFIRREWRVRPTSLIKRWESPWTNVFAFNRIQVSIRDSKKKRFVDVLHQLNHKRWSKAQFSFLLFSDVHLCITMTLLTSNSNDLCLSNRT